MCAAAALVVVLLGTRLTFFNDDWYFLLQRPGLESHGGLDAVFAPHNSNSVALTALIYKGLVAAFGLGSQLPFRIVLALAVAAVGAAVFALVRERLGTAVGLASAAVVAFLGPAWEDLLFFASIDLVGSLAAGLVALWLLERGTPRGRCLACALLVAAVGFSNVGIPFCVAAAVLLLLQRRERDAWVIAVPIALFVAWWIRYGSDQPSHLSWANIGHLPRYALRSVAAGLASLTGSNQGTVPGTYTAGYVVLGIVLILMVVAVFRGWRPSRGVLVPLAALLTFWVLTGSSFISGREPFASRYQLIDVALIVIVLAELAHGARAGQVTAGVVLVAAVAVVSLNVASRLTDGYRFLRSQSGFVKADLAALELGRRTAPPDLALSATVARNPYLSGVTAGRFFAQADEHGRVARFGVAELVRAPADMRQAADSVLAYAERVVPVRTAIRVSSRQCPRVSVASETTLVPGQWLVQNRDAVRLAIGVRRFGTMPVYLGLIDPGWVEQIVVPADRVALPWRLRVKAGAGATGDVQLCRSTGP